MDIFFRQRWKDYRLKHNVSRTITPLLGLKSSYDFVWVPDSVFSNSVSASKHYVTITNEKLDIVKDGSIFTGTR